MYTWNFSPELYYTVASIKNEDGTPATSVQDHLLQMAADKIETNAVPEGGIRKWLQHEKKKIKGETITETTKLELPIMEINGQRYILADVIPSGIDRVEVKYTVTIEYEQSELETSAQEAAA